MSRNCAPTEITAPFGPRMLFKLLSGNWLPIAGPESQAPRHTKNAQSKLRIVRRSGFIGPSALLLLAGCSAAFGLDYQIEANIHYDKYPETVLDILQPRAPALGNRPGIIAIHGGGWVQGEKERILKEYCLPLIRHGFVVANIEYRLAKAAPAPAAVNDALQAAQWFHDHARSI